MCTVLAGVQLGPFLVRYCRARDQLHLSPEKSPRWNGHNGNSPPRVQDPKTLSVTLLQQCKVTMLLYEFESPDWKHDYFWCNFNHIKSSSSQYSHAEKPPSGRQQAHPKGPMWL